tara:strand:+ start:40905 stop:42533 length:1629 start_codon:yes stop_codon:yes gene_type:complete
VTAPETDSDLFIETEVIADGTEIAIADAQDAPLPSTSTDELQESINRLDAVRMNAIQMAGLRSADEADWMTICRRLSLALVGSGMSVEEIRELQTLPVHRREHVHLENLLRDRRFHNYWAERYTRFLVGTDEGPFIVYRRRRFRTWLSDAIAQNRRYDQIVRDLITAEGLWTDRPEVNFYTVTFDSGNNAPDPVRLAARTSRAFLGLRIDCLQCHNDFLGNVNLGDTESPREGLQTDFHQLAAFFTAAKYNGLQGIRSGKSDYKYQYLDADEEVNVPAAVPYSPSLLPQQGNDRYRLAAWITHKDNRQAARAAVSHVWALMYGRPAGDAVDNLPIDETSTPVLEALTDDFIQHDFNLRRLIRVIARSDAFRVDSRAIFDVTPDHEAATAVFPLVRLRPEQVAGSVLQSARIKKTDRESSLFVQLQTFGQSNDFIRRYGDLGEDEFSSDSVTITQRLLTMNGRMLRESIKSNPILNASSHIAMFAKEDDRAIETVYLATVNRMPTEAERSHFTERFAETKNRTRAIEDLFWVLLNSTELAWNH